MVTDTLGFVPLPPLYWLYLAIMLLGYALRGGMTGNYTAIFIVVWGTPRNPVCEFSDQGIEPPARCT